MGRAVLHTFGASFDYLLFANVAQMAFSVGFIVAVDIIKGFTTGHTT